MAEGIVRLELEYLINTTPKILFNRLSTPSGLSEWFADNVIVEEDVFIFQWEGSEQSAKQTITKENSSVRYTWLEDDDTEGEWFELCINIEELTGDVALIITDNIEKDEIKDITELWNQQIETLKQGIGSS